ncbi:uncharacterized protein METZ01_LOCUS457220, partial [marine metagenome]
MKLTLVVNFDSDLASRVHSITSSQRGKEPADKFLHLISAISFAVRPTGL